MLRSFGAKYNFNLQLTWKYLPDLDFFITGPSKISGHPLKAFFLKSLGLCEKADNEKADKRKGRHPKGRHTKRPTGKKGRHTKRPTNYKKADTWKKGRHVKKGRHMKKGRHVKKAASYWFLIFNWWYNWKTLGVPPLSRHLQFSMVFRWKWMDWRHCFIFFVTRKR